MSFIILRKTIKLELGFKKFIFKPIVATAAMCACSYYIYTLLLNVLSARIATIIGLIIAVIIYLIMVIILKIFTKEEILMIPYGQKINKILETVGIYGKEENNVND